jgi:hypothetical protein
VRQPQKLLILLFGSNNKVPMPRDSFDPTLEQQNVALIDAATLQKAQRMIAGCES